MEKLNIAEILIDCPKGMELDCTMFDDVKFISVEEYDKPICIKTGDIYRYLTKFGTWTFDKNAKCVIFPKGKTTWEGFQRPFKDGDVVTWEDRGSLVACIYKERKNTASFNHHIALYKGVLGIVVNGEITLTDDELCLATLEEKEKLFDAIKENGYKWNPEAKTLEKLIESKEDTDDRIVMSGIYFDRENYADEVELHLNNYEIEIRNGKTYAVFKNQETKALKPKFQVGDRIKLKNTPTNNILTVTKTNDDGSLNVNMYSWVIEYELQDEYELVLNNQSKFKVGDKIKKKGDTRLITIKDVRDDYYIVTFPDYFGNCYVTDKLSFSNQGDYELVPNKFDITTLKPFDKVLVRDSNDEYWNIGFFSFQGDKHFCTARGYYAQCIHYEENKHLLGTTNDCDDYYKTWE